MTQLYAGVGRELITPAGAGYLAGDVLDTDAEVQRVHKNLYAQSLFLTDRRTRLVLITVDVCKVSAAMVEAVVTRLGEELGLPGAAIMIAASHTHSAPHTIEGDAAPGAFDNGFAEEAAAGMIASALQAAGKLEPVTLRYERGHSDLGVNKRVSTPWGVFMRANPDGDYDPEVGVLIAERAAGKPVAVLCCYASHPIGHLRSEISSDLSGFCAMSWRKRSRTPWASMRWVAPAMFRRACAGRAPTTRSAIRTPAPDAACCRSRRSRP